MLLLAIWGKRTNAWGALACMTTGFVVTALAMLLSETGAIGLPSVLAGAVGLPLALGAGVVVSRLTPAPGRNALDIVRDVRVPGGETVYDREMRLLRLRSRARRLTALRHCRAVTCLARPLACNHCGLPAMASRPRRTGSAKRCRHGSGSASIQRSSPIARSG